MPKIRVFVLVLTFLICSGMLYGQQSGSTGGAGTTGGSTGGTGSRTTSTTTTTPRQPSQQPQIQEPPIFLTGRVVTEDGNPPPERVVIERVCNGSIRREGYSDSKGYFSIQLGQTFGVMQDASIGTFDDITGNPTSQSPRSQTLNPMGRTTNSMLLGCELRASLAGYRSDSLNLTGRRPLDHPEVGTIVLHPFGKVEGTVISATSLQAPKAAKKALEKGREYEKKSNWAESQQELEKAVQIFPKYAEAWFELGLVQEKQGHTEEARKAYSHATDADARFIRPYFQLAQMAAQESKWQEVADLTDKALALDAYEFPAAYFYNSVAYYNLHKLDLAERSARRAKRMDSQHKIPRIDLLLSNILIERQDYAGAADLLRDYLKSAPDAPEAENAKAQLTKIERVLATSKSAPTAPPPQ